MDIRHAVSSDIQVVRTCYNDDGMDLLAVANGNAVEVFQVVRTLSASRPLLRFFLTGQ